MGIRVHTVLGYGANSREIAEMVDTESYNLNARAEITAALNKDRDIIYRLLNQYGARIDINYVTPFTSPEPLIGEVVEYAPLWIDEDEHRYKYMLSIRPTSEDSWMRYDDIIDYMYETCINDQEDNVTWLDMPIYPYNSAFVRIRKPDSSMAAKLDLDRMCVSSYFRLLSANPSKEIADHLKNDWMPEIASEVIITSYIILKDKNNADRFISSLRPCIWTFWR